MTDASADMMPLMTVFRQLFNLRRARRPVRGSAQRGALRMGEGGLAAPGERVSGDTNEPMPPLLIRPRDSHALVARDGFRALDGGAKVE